MATHALESIILSFWNIYLIARIRSRRMSNLNY